MHAIGDRATRDALDAVEAAHAANGPNDNRHHVAHLQFVHPDDVSRFAALGVIANMQPLWACMDPQMSGLTLPRVGEERMGWQYPFGDLVRTGATLAGGSDWPVSTPDPLLEMEVAVTRVDPGARDVEPFLPDQRLTLGQAFAAFTMGSATVNHDERDAGSIEVGKRADLAVTRPRRVRTRRRPSRRRMCGHDDRRRTDGVRGRLINPAAVVVRATSGGSRCARELRRRAGT